MKKNKITKKVCLVYSTGGHYFELVKSLEGIQIKKKYHVTFFSKKIKKKDKVYFIKHPQKNAINLFINFLQSLFILLLERPKMIISTGADVAVMTFILGKILLRTKNIFIESIGNMDKPTLSGRICYKFSDLFIIQFKKLKKIYPNAKLAKGIIN